MGLFRRSRRRRGRRLRRLVLFGGAAAGVGWYRRRALDTNEAAHAERLGLTPPTQPEPR